MSMIISSPAFTNQAMIPSEYTCEGEGTIPPLEISQVPEDAKSLALIVDDPDAPGGLFTHWVVWNIPSSTTDMGKIASIAEVMEGKNSTGEIGWIAPCPPSDTGLHHYRFQLFALSQKIDISKDAERDEVEQAIKDYVVDRAELVGTYTTEKNQPENPTELP